MEDPWAVWGKPSSASADKMRMPTSTPSPEPVDLDPWAKPTPAKPPRSPSPTRFSPKSPSKLSQVTLPSPPLSTGLGFPSREPKLDGWDDVGWGTPKPAPEPVSKPTAGLPGERRLRSPSLDLDAGWGAEPSKPIPEPERAPSPSPKASPATSPRKSVETRVLSSDLPRLSGELPRLSLEAEAFSRPGSAALPPLPDSRAGSVRLSLDQSPRVSAEISPPSPPAPLPVHTVAFDTVDLGAGFATPFGPSSPKDGPKLDVPSELKRSASFGSDFGGFADVGGDDGGGWGDTSWKDDDAGWKEESYGGWGDVPRPESPPKQSQQELDWEAAQRRLAAADARAPHERVMRLRRGWEEVAESVIGDKLETSESEEAALDDGARALQESVRETLRALTEVPDTSFAFGHSATRERYAQALSRAAPNAMTLLRAPRPRRVEGGGLDFGPGLEGWAARSRLGEPEAAQAAAPEPEQAKGWSFWRRQTTPKPLVTSGGGVLEAKTDIDTASIGSRPGSVRSKPPSIASRPGTPPESRPSMSTRVSVSSIPRQGSISAPSPLSAAVSGSPSVISPVGTPAPIPKQEPAPSRMSRLFRWGKKDEKRDEEDKDKELELGESDFAFLDQVPSMGGPDLLGGGMASIDEVLSTKKEVPLPAPLAPPPRSGSGSARPSMGARPAPPRNDAFDLFASLDFDDTSAPAPASTTTQSSAFAWDDLLAPSAPSSALPKLSPPRTSTPPVGGRRSATPPVKGMGLYPQRAPTPPIMGTGLAPTRSATPPLRSHVSPPTPERPRYGPSGPALGAHSRHRSSASGMGSVSRKPMSPPPRKPTSPPPPPKDFGFGDLSFGLDPPPSAKPAPASNDLFGGMAALAPSPRGPPGPSMMGMAPLAPSPPPRGMGMAALAPSPPSMGGMGMAPLRPSSGMAGMAGMTALAPSPPPSHPGTSSTFALAPPPSASPAPSSPAPISAPPPSAPAPAPAADDDFGDFGDFGGFDAPASGAAADDDFGDFGDFGDAGGTSGFNAGTSGFDSGLASNAPAYSSFGAPRPQPQAAQAMQPSQPFQSFHSQAAQPPADPFDFSAFEAPLTPAKPRSAPTPIAKSIPPTPIDKSPAKPFAFPLPPPGDTAPPAGASLSRNSSLNRAPSQSRPVFARPAGLPTGLTKSRQSSFTDSTGHVHPIMASPTPASSRRTPSVDHRATLTLMAAAHAKDASAEGGPLSPVPEPLSPPPGGAPQGFAALLPPPPGGVRRPTSKGGGLIDLMDD